MIYATVELTEEDAVAFAKFREYQDVIGYFVGHLDSIAIKDMRNSQVILDIDNVGVISHVAITKHFRK